MFGGTMIIKTIELKTISDILSLDIIDLNHLNGYWANSAESINTIWSWATFNGRGGFFASWIEPDNWDKYKWGGCRRNDFPGWSHVGDHVSAGMDYWDWFMDTRQYDSDSLHFSDSPDFFGTLGVKNFWGDIGKVSASAFAITLKQLDKGDLWITLVGGGERHIVLEARYSPRKTWAEMSRTKTLT